MSTSHFRVVPALMKLIVLLAGWPAGRLAGCMDAPAGAVTTPGFTDRVAFSGLNNPTSVALRDDTRVFVSQKAGVIKVFDSLDSLDDTTPTVFADPSTQVDDPLSVA